MPPIDEKSIIHYENDIEYFASSMNSLFTNLNVKEEIYSMGRLSNIVAEKLSTLPVAINRRKVIIKLILELFPIFFFHLIFLFNFAANF